MVWLGPHPHVEHRLEVLGQFGQPEFLEGEGEEARHMARDHGVREILNLEYWRRSWIVQEVMLGKKARLKSRSAEFDYEEFFALCEKFRLPVLYNDTRVESAWALLKLITLYKSSGKAFDMAE